MDIHFINHTLPNLRIFLIGPPLSGKTTIANGLSKLTRGRLPVLNAANAVTAYLHSDMSLQNSSHIFWPEFLYEINLQLAIKNIDRRVQTEKELKSELILQVEHNEDLLSELFWPLFYEMMSVQKGGWILESTKWLNLEWKALFGFHDIPYPASLAIALQVPDEEIAKRAQANGMSPDQICHLRNMLEYYYISAKEALTFLGFMGKVGYNLFSGYLPDRQLQDIVETIQRSL
ncbi:MAG: AAA family ATPase [Candidatus Margulisbacteria bacterium]|nr:AAA family ATPase [Candidatus Margulisiibacteriota bacterium]